jgi:catechol 2,3-dioxygenase-like lactoylglutathione lyase family enzyme
MGSTGALHHVELYVSELPRARDFWGWLLERLGYVIHQEWEQGFSYRLGTTSLVFVQTPAHHLAAGYHRKRIGLNHLAFHAGSTDQLEELRRELEKRGVNLLYSDTFRAPADTIYFEDPDRVKIELVSSVIRGPTPSMESDPGPR